MSSRLSANLVLQRLQKGWVKWYSVFFFQMYLKIRLIIEKGTLETSPKLKITIYFLMEMPTIFVTKIQAVEVKICLDFITKCSSFYDLLSPWKNSASSLHYKPIKKGGASPLPPLSRLFIWQKALVLDGIMERVSGNLCFKHYIDLSFFC